MLNLFSSRSSGMTGIDIGSASVKIVTMSSTGNSYSLNSYAIVPISATAVVDGSIEDVGVVASAIERGLKICGGKHKLATVAVPSSSVITKRIKLSNLFIGIDLEEQVKVEADQFIPYPLEEVALDFEVLGPNAKDPNFNDILLVACRKDASETREDAVNSAGIKCEIIDVDTYAMERSLALVEDRLEEVMVATIDIGASTLCLNVFHEGKAIYNREQAFNGNELSMAISQQLGKSIEEVEVALQDDMLNQNIIDDFLEPFIGTVTQQISRSLQFFYSSGIHGRLTKLYICGGLSGLPDLCVRLADELDLSVEILNPFSKCRINPKLNAKRLNRDSALLVKACGLALRSNINRTR